MFILFAFVALLASCKDKTNEVATQETPKQEAEETIDFFTTTDTAILYKKYPMLKESTKDTPFDTLNIQQKFQMLEARAFFKDGKSEKGAFGDQYFSFLRDATRKSFEKDLICQHIMFKPGTAELEGTDSPEMYEIIMASYSSLNLYFKVKINASDAALRKARIESVKNAFSKARVNLQKISFDETANTGKDDDKLVLHLYQQLPFEGEKAK